MPIMPILEMKMNAPIKMSTNKKDVEKLYESENYLVVNKPYDMYINSDNEDEKVIVIAKKYTCCTYLFGLFTLACMLMVIFCLVCSSLLAFG